MRRRSRLILFVFFLLALTAVTWRSLEWFASPVVVDTVRIESGEAIEILAVNGTVEPKHLIYVGSQIAGQIIEIKLEEGDQVATDDFIASLDDRIAKLAVEQARANLESATSDMKSRYRDWQRLKAAAPAVSEQELEDGEFAYKIAAAREKQLAASYRQAEEQLALHQIRSPADGTILKRFVEVGEVVSATSRIVSLGDMAEPLVEAEIDEVFAARLHHGMEARIAPVGMEFMLDASVDFVAPTVDRSTGSRLVKLRFARNPPEPLPRGLTVSVNIVVARFSDAITVPRNAILSLNSSPYVLLVRDGMAVQQPISVREWPSDRLVVTDGVKPGDLLILDPRKVQPGKKVRTSDEAQPK